MIGAAPAAGERDADAEERTRRILRERAVLLAKRVDEDLRDDVVDVVTFDIGSQRYGVGTTHVREVLREAAVTPLGAASSVIVGVANLRGDIVTVADIGALIGTSPTSSAEHVLVLHGPGPPLGVLVDVVDDMVQVATDSIAPLQHGSGELVLGVTADLVLLDGERLLTDRRLFITDSREQRDGV